MSDSSEVEEGREARHETPAVEEGREARHETPAVEEGRQARHEASSVEEGRQARHETPAVEEGRQARHETPLLRVVNADATPEEIAALVAVFSALGSGTEEAAPRRTPEWSRPARGLRRPLSFGPGGWRASGMPH